MDQDISDDSPALSRGQLGLLDGKAAVVVGGSRGVGRAVAELLAALGAGVVINGREPDAMEEAVEAVSTAAGADGRRALGFPGSPADETTAQALIATCVEEFGAIDIVVNCAGIPEPPKSSILTVTGEEFDAP